MGSSSFGECVPVQANRFKRQKKGLSEERPLAAMAHGSRQIRASGSPLIIRPDFIGALVLAPRLFRQVAGLHRASPSAALDKSISWKVAHSLFRLIIHPC